MATERNVRRISNVIGEVFKILFIFNDDYLGDHDLNVTVSNDFYPKASIEFGNKNIGWEVLEPLSDFFKKEGINWSIDIGEDKLTAGNSIVLKFDCETA